MHKSINELIKKEVNKGIDRDYLFDLKKGDVFLVYKNIYSLKPEYDKYRQNYIYAAYPDCWLQKTSIELFLMLITKILYRHEDGKSKQVSYALNNIPQIKNYDEFDKIKDAPHCGPIYPNPSDIPKEKWDALRIICRAGYVRRKKHASRCGSTVYTSRRYKHWFYFLKHSLLQFSHKSFGFMDDYEPWIYG